MKNLSRYGRRWQWTLAAGRPAQAFPLSLVSGVRAKRHAARERLGGLRTWLAPRAYGGCRPTAMDYTGGCRLCHPGRCWVGGW